MRHRVDIACALVLSALALLVRLPNLMLVPRYTDEGTDVLVAVAIVRTGHLPLMGAVPYYGPFHAYLLAALFRLFGVNLLIPRLTTTVIGALLVAATYALGRLVWDRTAGLVAAALALTSPALVIYTSHHGWPNSLTPFFALLTLLTLYGGLTQSADWLVALSGPFAAVALQTHPTALIVLLSAAIAFFTRKDARRWLARPGPYVAVALFLFCYLPMLVVNVGPGSTIRHTAHDLSGILSPPSGVGEYFARLSFLARSLLFVVAGGYDKADLVLRVIGGVVALLLAIGIALVWRQDRRFVGVVLLASLMMFPVFLREFAMRYFMPLVPLAFVVLGVVASAALRFVAPGPFGRTRVAAAGLAAVIILITALPLLAVRSVYQKAFAEGRTNEEYLRIAALVAAAGACGPDLYVEDSARDFSTPVSIQIWYALHAVDYVLTSSGCSHMLLSPQAISECPAARCRRGWLIVPRHVSRPMRVEALQLIDVAAAPPVESTRVPVAFYRVTAPE